jgi:hypothetical protein
MCINTKYCIPLNSRIELFIPFRKKILTILASVSRYKNINSLYDTMYAEVLNPTQEYLEFVTSLKKRASRRITVHLDAELTYDGTNCMAVIENMSDNGLHAVFTPVNSSADLTPEQKVDVTFHTASGQALRLHCMEKWSRPVSDNELTIGMGLEILEPPSQYNEFLKTLR